jgi:Xaa-Pro aminopeptidase
MNQYFTEKEMLSRREKLFAKMEDFSVLVLFSGVEKKSSADANYNFVINKNFYYMTQIEQPDSMFVMVKTPTSRETYLFISPYDETKEKWTGKLLTSDEAREISRVDNILLNSTFDPKLDILINSIKEMHGDNCNVYIDLDDELKIASRTTTKEFKDSIQNRYDNIVIFNAYNLLVDLRMIKSYEEINRIEQAIMYTKSGIDSVMQEIKPDMFEYELLAEFEYTLRKKYNTKVSFDTIAASGRNAAILHYPTPNDVLKDGDLMLFDLGAQCSNYCADVSRTFPINGKYSDFQLKLYNEVLKANEIVIMSVVPGVTITELQQIAIRSLSKSLMDLGLIQKEEDYIKYYFHNVSHHLGLDTHDPSFRDRPLEPGNIITVEPGLYIKELGIGIRIEDDILVTKTGNMNLTISIPKNAAEIERLLGSRG